MTSELKLDAVVVGGGVAGLWILNLLRSRGHSAVLLEEDRLGGTQTMASQGVLHGGLKYALNGVVTGSSDSLREMPVVWRDCLSGKGDVELTRVKVRSESQTYWCEPGIGAEIVHRFGRLAVAGATTTINQKDAPKVLRDPAYTAPIYDVDEQVIDVPSLVRALAEPYLDHIYRVRGLRVIDDRVELPDATVLRPGRVILAAGVGNGDLFPKVAMQRRPVHQVVLAMPGLPEFYSVCMGASTKPVVVTTSHETMDGTPVWNLGGELAETGVGRSPDEQITFAQRELKRLLPWIDLAKARWATVQVDRAEPWQASGLRPAGAFCERVGQTIVVWPTKLVLAPQLGADLLRLMPAPSGAMSVSLPLPRPEYAPTPWMSL